MITRTTSRKFLENRTAELQEYRHIRVWQRAMELTRKTLSVMGRVQELDDALCRCIRQTALQIPSGIAAGYSRGSRAEYVRMLSMVRGELAMLDSHCMLAHQLGAMDLTCRRQIEVLIIETAHLIDQAIEKQSIRSSDDAWLFPVSPE
ncbi:MAG TPA: four helix bundle protein [bacterium]|nr:four helix bundle protein [bacterium]